MNDLGQQQNPMPGSNNPQAIGSPNLVPQTGGLQVPVSSKPGAQLPVASGNLDVTTACEPNCTAQTSITQPSLNTSVNDFDAVPIIFAFFVVCFVVWIARTLQPSSK